MSYFLDVDDVKDICFDFAKAHLPFDEPFSLFEDRYENQLETALFSPQKSFGGKMVYPTLHQQAAVLFYEMIKLHPFVNGNKRVACVSLMVFLTLNEHWFTTDWFTLYTIAKNVAESDAKNRNRIIQFYADTFAQIIKKRPFKA
jgi:death-on-curing protein